MSIMIGFLTIFAIGMAEPAFAEIGGLQKINAFLENVLSILRGVSLTTVTIAVMWAGYKFLFKHADISEVGKILGGGLLIGGASEVSRYLLA